MAFEDSISLMTTTENLVEEQPVQEKELLITDGLEYFDLDLVVKKSDGDLKVNIRHDDDGQKHGLFVHGFRPGNLAEGVLNIGDEILEVNGMDVRSKYLEDIRKALNLYRLNDEVPMKIRRFKHPRLMLQKQSYEERVTSIKTKPITPTIVMNRSLSRNELNSLPTYSIIEGAVESPLLRGLETLKDAEFQDIEVVVTKVDGELKIHIRHDDEGDRHGLFVHGFRPGSLAETVLKIGDEVLEVNGADVQSKYLEDIIDALVGHDSSDVSMKVRRHILDSSLLVKSSRSNYPVEGTQMNPIEFSPSIPSVNVLSSRPTTSQFTAPRY
jgi:C-terminal processing protease CtpA/Prc